MDYEYYYNNARSRYYDACSGISGCERRISDLEGQRQQKTNLINKLKTDIKNNEEALEGINQIIKSNDDLNSRLVKITSKTTDAAENFKGMIRASDVVSKDLGEVYSGEMATTKRTLVTVFENLNTKKSAVSNRIADLKNQLRKAESELQDVKGRIKSTQKDLGSCKAMRTSASYDMEYYRRKMNEAR